MLLRSPMAPLLRARSVPIAAAAAAAGVAHRRCLSATIGDAAANSSSPGAGAGTAPPQKAPELVAELERLEKGPFLLASFYRVAGMFSDENWQAAAAGDIYFSVLKQSHQQHPVIVANGATPDRFYSRLQIRGLHCWLVHNRMNQEPRERSRTLLYEMMESIWNQAGLDLTRDFGFGYIEMSKHLKAAQLSWHGCCRNLDEALENEAPAESMVEVLLRNIYVDDEGMPLVDPATGEHDPDAQAGAKWLAEYLLAQRAHLAVLPAEQILRGRITWGDVSE